MPLRWTTLWGPRAPSRPKMLSGLLDFLLTGLQHHEERAIWRDARPVPPGGSHEPPPTVPAVHPGHAPARFLRRRDRAYQTQHGGRGAARHVSSGVLQHLAPREWAGLAGAYAHAAVLPYRRGGEQLLG